MITKVFDHVKDLVVPNVQCTNTFMTPKTDPSERLNERMMRLEEERERLRKQEKLGELRRKAYSCMNSTAND